MMKRLASTPALAGDEPAAAVDQHRVTALAAREEALRLTVPSSFAPQVGAADVLAVGTGRGGEGGAAARGGLEGERRHPGRGLAEGDGDAVGPLRAQVGDGERAVVAGLEEGVAGGAVLQAGEVGAVRGSGGERGQQGEEEQGADGRISATFRGSPLGLGGH